MRYQQTIALMEARKKLWSEFVATYQRAMIENPEGFSQFCAEFRERYLRGF